MIVPYSLFSHKTQDKHNEVSTWIFKTSKTHGGACRGKTRKKPRSFIFTRNTQDSEKDRVRQDMTRHTCGLVGDFSSLVFRLVRMEMENHSHYEDRGLRSAVVGQEKEGQGMVSESVDGSLEFLGVFST